MKLEELVKITRSCRRFYQNMPVTRNTLENFIDLARLSASAANKQPLRYAISCEPERNSLIYPTLSWAGYLTEWPGPVEGERPAAYIVVLVDQDISASADIDAGIACQSILLGASELGLGGCIIASVQREKLRSSLAIPAKYKILLVIALGKPKETVVIKQVREDDIRYWRDSDQVHHVPKRSLKDIILPDEIIRGMALRKKEMNDEYSVYCYAKCYPGFSPDAPEIARSPGTSKRLDTTVQGRVEKGTTLFIQEAV